MEFTLSTSFSEVVFRQESESGSSFAQKCLIAEIFAFERTLAGRRRSDRRQKIESPRFDFLQPIGPISLYWLYMQEEVKKTGVRGCDFCQTSNKKMHLPVSFYATFLGQWLDPSLVVNLRRTWSLLSCFRGFVIVCISGFSAAALFTKFIPPRLNCSELYKRVTKPLKTRPIEDNMVKIYYFWFSNPSKHATIENDTWRRHCEFDHKQNV